MTGAAPGVDMVPEFIHQVPPDEIDGVLSWYSTIHLTPSALDGVLTQFRRLLAPAGALVAGFLDSDDVVAEFDHKVVAAYRWPGDVFASRLAGAGFSEVERLRRQAPERPDRRYAAIAARAT